MVATRQCPYCKEEVRNDAVKCRYCQSPLQEGKTSVEEGSVVFILDKGLVKFAKFAGFILAIFFGFGIYVFGFNLEKASEKLSSAKEALDKKTADMNAAEKKLSEANEKLQQTEQLVRATAERITTAEKRVIQAQEEVDQRLANIRGQETISIEITARLNRMKQSWEGQQLAAATATERPSPEQNAEKARGGNSPFEKTLWKPGVTLRIAFMDGAPEVRAKVKQVAVEWTKYANLRFDFVDQVEGADIRVSFKQPGSWSFVGTDALKHPSNQATINFGWLSTDTSINETRRLVLHEFGHVLGLVEEMNNPNNDINWNVAAVTHDLSSPPNNWNTEQIERIVLKRYEKNDYPGYRAFDPQSIMMAPISSTWTKDGFSVGVNLGLSDSDKSFVSQIYPR